MKFASTVLAGLMILAAPWPIGGNYLYVRTVVLVLAAIFAVMAALTCLVERKHFLTSIVWAILPVAAIYAIYQTLSLSGPISIYPSGSRAQIYVLGSAIGLFLSSTVLFRERNTIEPLLACAAVVGFAVAFVGMVQNLGWDEGSGKVLWVYELLYGGKKPFGPFVNRNNGAGFLILTIAGPLYFLAKQFLSSQKNSDGANENSSDLALSTSSRSDRSKTKFQPIKAIARFLARLEAKHLYCLTGLIAIVAGAFFSFSRGGSVAIVIGLSAGIMMLMIANRWAVVLAVAVIVATGGMAFWLEQADLVSERMASIAEEANESSPRLSHWKDAIPYYQTHWKFGSGLGTYRYEYPIHQQQPFRGKFAHAESVFLETLAEMGVVGVAALFLTLLTLFYAAITLFRQRNISDQALGVASVASIVGLVVASVFDFGIYQPANFIVASILFGALVGRTSHPDCRENRSQPSGKPTLAKYFRFALLLVLVLSSAYSAFPSAAIESVQLAKRQIALHTKYKGENVRRLARAEKALEFAERFLPENWETQYLLGQCAIFRHRQTLTDQVMAETEEAIRAQGAAEGLSETEVEDQFPPRSDFWLTTSMQNLHRVLRLLELQNPPEFAAMRSDPTVVTPDLKKAWEHFHESVKRCDRSERAHVRLAQLTVLMAPSEGNRQAESEHVKNALELAKGFNGLLYDAGMLAMHSGDFEQAAELWADCLSRSRRYESQIVQFGTGLPAKLYFEKVLPQNPTELLKLSNRYFSDPENKVLNELLLVHTRRLIKSANLDDIEKSVLNGQTWVLTQDHEKACAEFEIALESNPKWAPWRLEYAKSLAKINRFDDAIKEMKICQLEQPDEAIKISRLVDRIKRDRLKQRNEPRNNDQE